MTDNILGILQTHNEDNEYKNHHKNKHELNDGGILRKPV